MTKYYAVFDEGSNFYGLLPKDMLDIFKRQRDISKLNLYKIKEKELLKKFGKGAFMNEAVVIHDYVLFPAEEEMFYMSFDQMQMDLHHLLESFYTRILPFLKLDDDEKEKIISFILILKEIFESDYYLDEDNVAEYDKIFNMDKMLRHFLKSFNGK